MQGALKFWNFSNFDCAGISALTFDAYIGAPACTGRLYRTCPSSLSHSMTLLLLSHSFFEHNYGISEWPSISAFVLRRQRRESKTNTRQRGRSCQGQTCNCWRLVSCRHLFDFTLVLRSLVSCLCLLSLMFVACHAVTSRLSALILDILNAKSFSVPECMSFVQFFKS